MKKIKLFITALFLLTAFFTKAQDVITLKNGEEIKAKVLEVGLGEIKYKKADNPNGPLYTTSKTLVFMIRYENGTKDVFTAPSMGAPDMRGDAHGYRGDNKGDYEMLMHKYRRSLAGGIVMTAIGVPMIPIGLGLTIGGIAASNSYDMYGNYYRNDGAGPMVVSGVLFLAGGIAMTVVGPIKISKAKRYKARAREIGPSMSFAPILSPAVGGQAMKTGAGININF
jgi:hypothetical protein